MKELNKALLLVVSHCTSQTKENVIDCIQILLSQGANIDAVDPQDGKTALMIACEKGYIEIVECLIDQEA